MTDPIPQSAIDAALKRYQFPSGKAEDSTADHEERMTAALEAAMPHIRKQIAEEIRYGINEYSGQLIEQAARIAEGETK